MNTILLVSQDKELKSVLKSNILAYLSIDTVECESAHEAIEFIKKDKTIKLVICSSEIGNSKPVIEINNYFKQLDIVIPIISLGDDPIEQQDYEKAEVYSVEQYDDIQSVLKNCMTILDLDLKALSNTPQSQYFPIPLEHFLKLKKSPSDVFIKIGRGENTQFLKRIHEGEGLDDETVKRYQSGGVQNLYISSEKRITFVNLLTKALFKAFEDLDEVTEENFQESLETTEIAYDIVSQNIDNLGISPQVTEMANKAINQLIKQAEKDPKVSHLLARLTQSRSSFRFKHIQITTYISMIILKMMDWGKKEQYKTLSFVSFFHDVSLPSDELAMIHSKEELNQAKLKKSEKDLILKHAQLSTELIHRYQHMPMGADTIIKQHHGMLNGHGFSETFSGNLSPLSVVFIVAEECAHLVLKSEDKIINKAKILFHLEEKFKTSRFQKMIQAIEEVL